jgi:hypothetical protein
VLCIRTQRDRSMLGYYKAAHQRRCYIQTAHRASRLPRELARKEDGMVAVSWPPLQEGLSRAVPFKRGCCSFPCKGPNPCQLG